MLGEENEQLFELLARLCLVFDGQLQLLLHDIVPLLQLNRDLGLFRALLLLCLELLGQLLDEVSVLLFSLLEIRRDLGVLPLREAETQILVFQALADVHVDARCTSAGSTH